MSAPILTFPDYSKQFILDTDASDTGIGGVFSQVQDGEERVVAYASRSLSKAERRYCVTRKELLAVVHFTKHFRPYLLGHHFVLRTDHSSLTWLQNFKEPEGQLARWLEKLQEIVSAMGPAVCRGVLWRKFESSDSKDCHLQVVLPKSLQEEALQELHEWTMSCHLGEEKTVSRLKERFYWPGH